ncbi:phage tail assembly chaperone [Pseudomonas sp. ChxA]|uniref:phage tail assembly chaperone n=1 Tax=Pseudomonas sp. ChxA TaxID=3035473 RepID=UPI0025560E52|nr:phage tail assembly chaperone [Pseudomonas sp. ChxA]MDL2187287.1 phage tail assembly chaperone [Pseudomonas sp. ChxA]
MAMYYCRVNETRGGFFDPRIHGEIGSPGCTIPEGAKELTDELYAELTAAQDNGKLVYPDADGYPVLIDPPPPSPEEQATTERTWRDVQLTATDGVVTRHRDELEEGVATTLTVEQYAELQVYRRQLRDWPENGEFPLIDHRPIAPPWLAEQTQ